MTMEILDLNETVVQQINQSHTKERVPTCSGMPNASQKTENTLNIILSLSQSQPNTPTISVATGFHIPGRYRK